MKTYNVTITEKLQMNVEIEADSAVQARDIAERQWKDGDHILDAGCFQGVTFTVRGRSDRER